MLHDVASTGSSNSTMSIAAAPGGIIGKHCSAGSTRQSITTVRLSASASRSAGSNSVLALDEHPDAAVGLGQLDVVRHAAAQVDVRAAAVEEHVLPLRDHAEGAVVDEHDDDREIVQHRRRQLLGGHLEAAVAVDADDRRLGPRGLGADRGGDPVAHRPEPARGDEVPRPLGEEVLHRPHLVLADARREDDVVSGGDCLQHLHQLLRLEERAALRVAKGELVAPLLDLADPGLRSRRSRLTVPAHLAGELGERLLQRPDDGDVGIAQLGDLGRVDVEMDHGGAGREGRELAGDAVVEARADRNQDIAGVHREVRPLRAVHAGPAEEQRMRLRERALPHQCRDHGQPAGLGELGAARRRRRR